MWSILPVLFVAVVVCTTLAALTIPLYLAVNARWRAAGFATLGMLLGLLPGAYLAWRWYAVYEATQSPYAGFVIYLTIPVGTLGAMIGSLVGWRCSR